MVRDDMISLQNFTSHTDLLICTAIFILVWTYHLLSPNSYPPLKVRYSLTRNCVLASIRTVTTTWEVPALSMAWIQVILLLPVSLMVTLWEERLAILCLIFLSNLS